MRDGEWVEGRGPNNQATDIVGRGGSDNLAMHTKHHVTAVQESLHTCYRMARIYLISKDLASMPMIPCIILLHSKLD